VAGFYEHGDEPSGSLKCREFLDYLKTSHLNRDPGPWILHKHFIVSPGAHMLLAFQMCEWQQSSRLRL
jgi:hypothetical protein